MRQVTIGNIQVSGVCIGGNPFKGYSHQTKERNEEMSAWFTPQRIKQTLREAEAAGINTVIARTDDHMISIIREYWAEGGKLQWIAQVVAADAGDAESWRKWLRNAQKAGAHALYIHGGLVDNWFAQKKNSNFTDAVAMIREEGKAVGFAAHMPEAHEWMRDHLDLDFHLCSHYNPTDRSNNPHHQFTGEKWDDDDRAAMLRVIETIEKPVVHYKVFAAGNKAIMPAFELLGKIMRPNHIVNMGMFTKDDLDMVRKNVALFEEYVERVPVK